MSSLSIKFIDDVKDHDYDVVQFHGELDEYSIPRAEDEIFAYLENHQTQHLIFDLSDLKFTNSSGLGFFTDTHAKLVESHKELILCGARPNVHDIFALIGIEQMVKIFPTMGDAISHIKKHKP